RAVARRGERCDDPGTARCYPGKPSKWCLGFVPGRRQQL
ncbi:uncharacterized protein METZ01_LOCUS408680, partial [marine metagenome]